MYVNVWFLPPFLHKNSEPARTTARYIITEQQPWEDQQIFNPTLARDGTLSTGCSQDGDLWLEE